jgi:hypothetical protein
VISAISFATSGNIYLLFAVVFSIAYIGLATFGAWWFLGRRRFLHHSWTAFAVVAASTTLLSLVVVRAIHGFGETVHQLSIVDAQSGQAFGHAQTFFGLKTGVDKKLDVWLPSDPLIESEPAAANCFLRPVPIGEDQLEGTGSFADPEDYRLIPASAVVENVRIRATLKRFEGRWNGPLGGRFDAQIAVNRYLGEGSGLYDFRFTDDSFVSNSLGVSLNNCYLVHAVYDLFVPRGEGPDFLSDRYRNSEIFAYPIGSLPGDGTKINLASIIYKQGDPPNIYDQVIAKNALKNAQRFWSAPFRGMLSSLGAGLAADVGFGLGNEENALLLLSTVGEYDFRSDAGMTDQMLGRRTFSRDRTRWLDARDHLRRHQMLLVGFADAPGPVRLFRREGENPYRAIEPSMRHSRTMYRIRIPVTVIDDRPDRDKTAKPTDEDA